MRPRKSSQPKRQRSCMAGRRPSKPKRRRGAPLASGAAADGLPTLVIARNELSDGVGLLKALVDGGFAASNGEARRAVRGGAVEINDRIVADERTMLQESASQRGRSDQAFARQEATHDRQTRLSAIRPLFAVLAWAADRRAGAGPPAPKICRKIPGASAETGFTTSCGSAMVPRSAKFMPKTPCPLPPVRSLAENRKLAQRGVDRICRNDGAADVEGAILLANDALCGGARTPGLERASHRCARSSRSVENGMVSFENRSVSVRGPAFLEPALLPGCSIPLTRAFVPDFEVSNDKLAAADRRIAHRAKRRGKFKLAARYLRIEVGCSQCCSAVAAYDAELRDCPPHRALCAGSPARRSGKCPVHRACCTNEPWTRNEPTYSLQFLAAMRIDTVEGRLDRHRRRRIGEASAGIGCFENRPLIRFLASKSGHRSLAAMRVFLASRP